MGLTGAATGSGAASATGSSASTGSGATACPPCVSDQDCASGSRCGQLAGDTYCAPVCSDAAPCAADRACTSVATAEGMQVDLCVPRTNQCGATGTGGGGQGGAGTTASSTGAGTSAASTGSGAEVCGSLHGPDSASCCQGCQAGQSCQTNGCYNGWWCNADTCKCQAPPTGSCGSSSAGSTSSSGSGTSSSSSSGGGTGGNGGSVGPTGGTLDTLSFAIVGDTRPATVDDTAGYPKTVIQKIWQDVEAHSPRPAFAVTTGDYVFAKPSGSQAAPQMDLYLAARAAFSNTVFYTLGNHECTGATDSNCGPGNTDGSTVSYDAFLSKMLGAIGQTKPYYTINVSGTGNAWTAKFIFLAANAWSSTQATWFTSELAKATTYTFVVRHEGSTATTAPGVTPSGTIMAQHPYTLLLAGHTHTFEYFASEKQVITGNGGAPLTGSINYGYVVARQRTDGAIAFTAYDYSTNAVIKTFAVKADGSVAP